MIGKSRLAGIEYLGWPGISQACVRAVQRMIQFNDQLVGVTVLSCRNAHCLLVTVNEDDKVAIKSGFSSGYNGEGPRAFAKVLQLFIDHEIDIDEVEVKQDLLDRLDLSALTVQDIEHIDSLDVVLPTRVFDYIYDSFGHGHALGDQWRGFPAVLPFSVIDRRLADLALRFRTEPGDALLQGFRRLEDTVRSRTGLHEHGSKLFSQAFQGEQAKLTWDGLLPAETVGRVHLFTGAYMAHRNPRAHREIKDNEVDLVSEFLLLNHLFRLEASAVPNNQAASGVGNPQPISTP